MKNHINFAELKNCLLEEELKIQEFPENRNQSNVPFKNKKMTTLVTGKKEQETSKKSFEPKHPDKPFPKKLSSIDNVDTNSSEEEEEEEEDDDDDDDDDEEKQKEKNVSLKEQFLQKEIKEKNDICKNTVNLKATKLNKIIDKVKESYNLFKNDNFSFCNNMNQLISDINTEMSFDENALNKNKKILENEKKSTYIKEKEPVPFEQVLQNKIKNSKQLIVLKNFYNEVLSVVNDFVDVYLEKDSLNKNEIHTNLYNNAKIQNGNKEYCLKEIEKKELRENKEEEISYGFKTKEIMKREDIHSNFHKSVDVTKKDLYEVNENILLIDCKLKDIKTANAYDQACTKVNEESIKKPHKNIHIKTRTTYKENSSRQTKKEKNTLHEENLSYEELLAGALSSFQTNNEVDNQDEYLSDINKENILDSSNYFNNSSSTEKEKTFNRKIEKFQNVDERIMKNYPMSKNNNKMDYAEMITSYMQRKNPNENKKSKNMNFAKKGNRINNPTYKIGNEEMNDDTVYTQGNDPSIFDISQMTEKYKYQSNIMFTINKVKNLEPVIEVNISISDIQLRIPGLRVENVILPYKVSDDVLVVQIKTLVKNRKNRQMTNSGESEDSEPEINNQGRDQMKNFLFKYQLKEEKSKEIKYYYLFIPLNHINEELINKRLLLITPKYRRIFEKENLLPVTIYLIESKELTSSTEKHLYISIKKCINGIHYYPFSDISNELENLSDNGKEKMKTKPFTPVYVSLYNDEMDRAIGNIMNDNKLVGKVQVNKLQQKRRYLINKKEYEIFYNEERKLMCKHIEQTSNHEFTPMPLMHLFHILCNNFVITKSTLDLFPLYVFPPIKDITYFEYIETDEFLQLQFLLHFLAIMEQISFYLCRMLQLPIKNQKSHSPVGNEPEIEKPYLPLLFSNHIQPIVMRDKNGKENYYTFLYSSYGQKNENNGYPFNYIKPIIYRIDVHEQEQKDENSKACSQQEQFIYSYANQHSIHLFNLIQNYEEVKSIVSCYDSNHCLFFTTDQSRKQFQEFYLSIFDKYQQLMELQWDERKAISSNNITSNKKESIQYNTKKNKQFQNKNQVSNSYHENSVISTVQPTKDHTKPSQETTSLYASDYSKQSTYNRNIYHKNTSFQDNANEKKKKNELSSSEKIFLSEQNQFSTCDFAQVFEDYYLEEQDSLLSKVANKSELDMLERLTNNIDKEES